MDAESASSASSTHTETVSPVLTLTLKAEKKAEVEEEPVDGVGGVTWHDDVVDNEHMNKKSSKACCIFHKPRSFGESDSDESDRCVIINSRLR
jgi:hypothetical protein